MNFISNMQTSRMQCGHSANFSERFSDSETVQCGHTVKSKLCSCVLKENYPRKTEKVLKTQEVC